MILEKCTVSTTNFDSHGRAAAGIKADGRHGYTEVVRGSTVQSETRRRYAVDGVFFDVDKLDVVTVEELLESAFARGPA